MRIVLQVVSRAAVTVAGETVGEIEGPGVLALVGVTHTDTPETAARLAEKVAGLRILPGETSCADGPSPVLVVSQFTLYGDVRKGRRPSWSRAAPGDVSEPLFEEFVRALRGRGIPVETGRFGAHMEVSLVNDGPVTVLVDSEELDRPRRG
ncbi:D-aminoacyl-tRNA deacylase [Kocuria rhizophila]|uniref:D-aminoacyl-tRNA deacylase n=1 Tax=Kocuria rhizophila TaxID=72000 RepID=A0AAX2SF94_KOCRH|nr:MULTISPECIES: D-aminoacyl-tRNA deacylase [Kocuria]WIW68481.1 D-aminoacyl-tRNA deacylase [Kocuria sp. ChxB]KIC69523.1 D-tyrosyl-tRNA(Tyr) deacylase [Kocuria rhizophila]MBO4144561.1 D-tyrosyl-tRNA(Tyr) deacylase [Kocuria rhizophila]MCG7425594.1 D-aminoacyl-tRNA deacylase [Kocuria rhizophila]MCR4524805.1 D-aminoacyl-tRNA deacylase [Kocuria rhizophila]